MTRCAHMFYMVSDACDEQHGMGGSGTAANRKTPETFAAGRLG